MTLMTTYQEKIRNSLINQGVHLNDDTIDSKIGQTNSDYDFEEHEQFIGA